MCVLICYVISYVGEATMWVMSVSDNLIMIIQNARFGLPVHPVMLTQHY